MSSLSEAGNKRNRYNSKEDKNNKVAMPSAVVKTYPQLEGMGMMEKNGKGDVTESMEKVAPGIRLTLLAALRNSLNAETNKESNDEMRSSITKSTGASTIRALIENFRNGPAVPPDVRASQIKSTDFWWKDSNEKVLDDKFDDNIPLIPVKPIHEDIDLDRSVITENKITAPVSFSTTAVIKDVVQLSADSFRVAKIDSDSIPSSPSISSGKISPQAEFQVHSVKISDSPILTTVEDLNVPFVVTSPEKSELLRKSSIRVQNPKLFDTTVQSVSFSFSDIDDPEEISSIADKPDESLISAIVKSSAPSKDDNLEGTTDIQSLNDDDMLEAVEEETNHSVERENIYNEYMLKMEIPIEDITRKIDPIQSSLAFLNGDNENTSEDFGDDNLDSFNYSHVIPTIPVANFEEVKYDPTLPPSLAHLQLDTIDPLYLTARMHKQNLSPLFSVVDDNSVGNFSESDVESLQDDHSQSAANNLNFVVTSPVSSNLENSLNLNHNDHAVMINVDEKNAANEKVDNNAVTTESFNFSEPKTVRDLFTVPDSLEKSEKLLESTLLDQSNNSIDNFLPAQKFVSVVPEINTNISQIQNVPEAQIEISNSVKYSQASFEAESLDSSAVFTEEYKENVSISDRKENPISAEFELNTSPTIDNNFGISEGVIEVPSAVNVSYGHIDSANEANSHDSPTVLTDEESKNNISENDSILPENFVTTKSTKVSNIDCECFNISVPEEHDLLEVLPAGESKFENKSEIIDKCLEESLLQNESAHIHSNIDKIEEITDVPGKYVDKSLQIEAFSSQVVDSPKKQNCIETKPLGNMSFIDAESIAVENERKYGSPEKPSTTGHSSTCHEDQLPEALEMNKQLQQYMQEAVARENLLKKVIEEAAVRENLLKKAIEEVEEQKIKANLAEKISRQLLAEKSLEPNMRNFVTSPRNVAGNLSFQDQSKSASSNNFDDSLDGIESHLKKLASNPVTDLEQDKCSVETKNISSSKKLNVYNIAETSADHEPRHSSFEIAEKKSVKINADTQTSKLSSIGEIMKKSSNEASTQTVVEFSQVRGDAHLRKPVYYIPSIVKGPRVEINCGRFTFNGEISERLLSSLKNATIKI